MDQETAKKLFENGATLVILDMPQNSEFGIDYNSWRIGPNFRGIKMIPPGIHFIYYSVCDKQGNLGIRNGFFNYFKSKEIILKKWNKQAEMIDNSQTTDDDYNDDLERIRLNKHDLDRFLGSYPYDEYKKWISLSNYLNEEMLNKLLPLNKIITSETMLIGQKFTSNKTAAAAGENTDKKMEIDDKNLDKIFQIPKSLKDAENLLPKMTEIESEQIRFTKIPQHVYPTGANASQITSHSIDMSFNLEQLLQNTYDSKYENLLCELQFTFICFLIGYVYDAFEQWKLLVNLLCNSENIIKTIPNLYLNLIQILYYQLKEMPDDFFSDIITKNNFLIICLHNLFDNIDNIDDNSNTELLNRLKDRSKQFRIYLKELFQFDFDIEPDEYAPSICE